MMDPYLQKKIAEFCVRREQEQESERQNLARRVENVKTLLADHYDGTPVFETMRQELRSKKSLLPLASVDDAD